MPKFKCRCGYVINCSLDDIPEEKSIILNMQISAVSNLIAANLITGNNFYETLCKGEMDVIYCSNCGCMHVDENCDGNYTCYVKEQAEPLTKVDKQTSGSE